MLPGAVCIPLMCPIHGGPPTQVFDEVARFSAPEVMLSRQFTQASDIWSMGVFMLDVTQPTSTPFTVWGPFPTPFPRLF